MKKLFCILLIFLCYSITIEAQTIRSLRVFPSNPTVNDTIYLFADLQFSSSGCELDNDNFSINQKEIVATSHHCMGLALAICNITDTFKLGKLSAGTYNFDLTLTTGASPAPCIPGIVIDDRDTLSFTVDAIVGLEERKNLLPLEISPNPVKNIFQIRGNTQSLERIIIRTISGAVKFNQPYNQHDIDITSLDGGVYFLEMIGKKGERRTLKLVKQ